jgi:hypothetical protein
MAGLEKIIAKLEQVADNIVNLRVITAVGDFEIVEQDGQRTDVRTKNSGSNAAMLTEINLAEGDIKVKVDRYFEDPANKASRDYHEQQVANAQAIVKSNIESIEALVTLMVDTLTKDGRPPAGQ